MVNITNEWAINKYVFDQIVPIQVQILQCAVEHC